jgi:hypothetical protein
MAVAVQSHGEWLHERAVGPGLPLILLCGVPLESKIDTGSVWRAGAQYGIWSGQYEYRDTALMN